MSSAYRGFSRSTGFTQTISVTSGKGGVGKTTVVTNLAESLAARGHKLLILDGDLGMANVDIMFGKRAQKTLHDVFAGQVTLGEIITPVANAIDLIPGGSGIYGLHNLDFRQKHALLQQVNLLEKHYDYMIIDTAPGIDDNVLYLNAAAQEIKVVMTPDPSSITDAYALIKVLHQRHRENSFSIICNMVRDEEEAYRIFRRLSDVASQFLCVSLSLDGFIPHDSSLRDATKSQQLITRSKPRSQSSLAFRELAEKLSVSGGLRENKGGLQFFWEQVSGVA